MLDLNRITDGDIHTLADFAELLCLLKPDRVLSADDLDDHLVDVCGEQRGSRPLGDAFAHMVWRQAAFDAYYPFTVAANQQSITAPDNLTVEQQIYVFLLLCANLPFVGAPYNPLTDAFERLAHLALKRMWPEKATIKTFGKNNADYIGSKSERMHKLALDLGCRPKVDPAKFRPRDSGDGGIDLAGWLELDKHESENKLTCLAQCACSRTDWNSKQSEISRERIGKLFNPTAPWLEMLCIPICFRNNTGRWAFDADVGEIIMIDRLRLVQFIEPADLAVITPPPLLNNFLQSRLELV
ncbi:MAG: hypothetical protein AB7V26_07060 [Lysobacterales bacterium]